MLEGVGRGRQTCSVLGLLNGHNESKPVVPEWDASSGNAGSGRVPPGCFWNVCQDPNPAVENLEGSVPVARESNSMIKSSPGAIF